MMTQEYIDHLDDNYWFDSIFDDMFWDNKFNSEKIWNLVLQKANNECIILEDMPEFDYDTCFWKMYKNAEKGLS